MCEASEVLRVDVKQIVCGKLWRTCENVKTRICISYDPIAGR